MSNKTYEETPDGSFREVLDKYEDVVRNWPTWLAEGLGYKVTIEKGQHIDEQA